MDNVKSLKSIYKVVVSNIPIETTLFHRDLNIYDSHKIILSEGFKNLNGSIVNDLLMDIFPSLYFFLITFLMI